MPPTSTTPWSSRPVPGSATPSSRRSTGRGSTVALLLQLVEGLVGERARATDDAHGPTPEGDLARGDADVALTRRDDAGAVRPQQAGVREVALEDVERPGLVLGGDALGDAHHER